MKSAKSKLNISFQFKKYLLNAAMHARSLEFMNKQRWKSLPSEFPKALVSTCIWTVSSHPGKWKDAKKNESGKERKRRRKKTMQLTRGPHNLSPMLLSQEEVELRKGNRSVTGIWRVSTHLQLLSSLLSRTKLYSILFVLCLWNIFKYLLA